MNRYSVRGSITMGLGPCLRWTKVISQHENGFGLSESLVAVALLGTAIISLTVTLSTGSLGVSAMRQGATAQSIAQTQLAYTKSYPYDTGATTYPGVDVYDATYNTNPITLPDGYSIVVEASTTTDADSDIQKITATVTRGGEDLLELEDFKVNR